MTFESTILKETVGYDIYKTFKDLFLPGQGIQSEDFCKIRSGAGDRKTLGVDADNKLYQTKFISPSIASISTIRSWPTVSLGNLTYSLE